MNTVKMKSNRKFFGDLIGQKQRIILRGGGQQNPPKEETVAWRCPAGHSA